jgi:hypothetical protein
MEIKTLDENFGVANCFFASRLLQEIENTILMPLKIKSATAIIDSAKLVPFANGNFA